MQHSRKVDRRLLPILGALYTFALIDRTNIGVARISGLDQATGLDVGNRASIASRFFCVCFVFPASSMLLFHRETNHVLI